MKKRFLITRWIVGLLFIFSGLVKANDPLGLSYKMQEFFEAWGFNGSLNDYTLALSLMMNVFEVLAGVAVIIGWRMKLFSWLLLLLIIFFSFLTGYALLSGKIKTCGCFGDCLPLTPLESFLKDLFLLLLILILFFNKNRITSALAAPLPQTLLLVCIIAVSWMQWYVLNHLPFVDCLPYKPGKNIVEEMKVPVGSIPDRYEITFTYKKNGKVVEFSQDTLDKVPDLDTYEYVDRKEKIIKGNGGEAKIVDFALQTTDGTDTTLPVLNQGNYYIMLFAKTLDNVNDWQADMQQVLAIAKGKNIPFFLVTGEKDKAMNMFGANPNIHILICDGTVIKTAARVNPTYFIMKQAYIRGKWSYKNVDDTKKMLNTLQ
jgi:uncharacterized membrane protein YphA (DoxX/SURF4 family)